MSISSTTIPTDKVPKLPVRVGDDSGICSFTRLADSFRMRYFKFFEQEVLSLKERKSILLRTISHKTYI